MPSNQSKTTRLAKNYKNVTHTEEEKKAVNKNKFQRLPGYCNNHTSTLKQLL